MHVVQHWVNNLADTKPVLHASSSQKIKEKKRLRLLASFNEKPSIILGCPGQFKSLKSTCYSAALHVTMTCLDVNKRHMLGCQMGDVIVQLLLNSSSLDLA